MAVLTYPGTLAAKINSAGVLLQKAGLLIRENPTPCTLSEAMSRSRKLDYVHLWQLLIEKNCFNFVLRDYSIFYFLWNDSTGKRSLAFSFYESPHTVPSAKEFIAEAYGPEFLDVLSDAELESVVPDYEQFVAELPLKKGVTPVRYDYSEAHYVPGRHPVSHLHVGYDNEMRISVDRILNPLSFVAFILRQYYPAIWKDHVLAHHRDGIRGDIRRNLSLVDGAFRVDLDEYELVLK